ncbi:MAG: hypothetical protein WAM82_08820 [Thermoanaerobaculia bacterium]
MSALTEQTTTQLAYNIPNRASMISHDSVNRVIGVEVMVAQPPGSDDLTISVPPIAVPTGMWTVNLDLVVITPGLQAQFAPSGIALVSGERPLPPRVTINSPAAVSPQRWAIQLCNDVSAVDAFNYRVGIGWSAGGGGNGPIPAIKTTFHDPTIVVVRDPIDPPSPPPDTPLPTPLTPTT